MRARWQRFVTSSSPGCGHALPCCAFQDIGAKRGAAGCHSKSSTSFGPGAERLLRQRCFHELVEVASSTAPVLEVCTPVRTSFTIW